MHVLDFDFGKYVEIKDVLIQLKLDEILLGFELENRGGLDLR